MRASCSSQLNRAPGPKWQEPRYLPDGVSPAFCTVTGRGTHVIIVSGKFSSEMVKARHGWASQGQSLICKAAMAYRETWTWSQVGTDHQQPGDCPTAMDSCLWLFHADRHKRLVFRELQPSRSPNTLVQRSPPTQRFSWPPVSATVNAS